MTFLVMESEDEGQFSTKFDDRSSLRGRWGKEGFLRAVGIRDLSCIPPVLPKRAVKDRDRMGRCLRAHASGRVAVPADKQERREVFGVGAPVLDVLAEMCSHCASSWLNGMEEVFKEVRSVRSPGLYMEGMHSVLAVSMEHDELDVERPPGHLHLTEDGFERDPEEACLHPPMGCRLARLPGWILWLQSGS